MWPRLGTRRRQSVPKLQRPVDLLLSGMADRITGDGSSGSGAIRTALELMCSSADERGQALRWMSLALAIVQESAAGELWDDELGINWPPIVVRQARDAGALAALPRRSLSGPGPTYSRASSPRRQHLSKRLTQSPSPRTTRQTRYHSLTLPAWRGNPADALGLLEAAAAVGTARGEGRLVGVVDYLTAVLYNGLARYEEAFAVAREASEHGDLGFHWWSLLELTEAAVHTGQREAAVPAARHIEERVLPSGTDFGLGLVASARALVAENDAAESLYIEAIERLERTRIVVDLARARLRYGEWLRRVNRRHDARRHLNEAREMFSRMGAQAFAERARRELVATGEKVRKQPVSSGGEMTAQEAQIARLAGDGLTNQEIGAQLFISTHTVEWHLRKVFVKLGITSRRQLRTVSWAS